MKAAIVGLHGQELLPDEVTLFRSSPPAGVILFRRNIVGAMPLARLIGDLREVLPPETLLVIDQEGGRVARLGPPDWPAYPSAGTIGAGFEADPGAALRLAWVTGASIGLECAEAGFDVVCAPVLDLRIAGATDAIGDRAYSDDPDRVVALAQSMADGLLSAGVQPVGKHAPGHGRAMVDSHHDLPRIPAEVDIAADLSVFAACSGLPWLMTAHVVYEALDAARPATFSPIVIEGVIRGTMGFDGVLVSDDLAMGALSGSASDRVRAAIAAGCDLAMHCSGEIDAAASVLRAAPMLAGESLARLDRARALADRSRLQLDRRALLADQAAYSA